MPIKNFSSQSSHFIKQQFLAEIQTGSWDWFVKNGLKVMSGTEFQANGAAYGNGIYFSDSFQLSFGYSSRCSNEKTVVGIFEINDDIEKYKNTEDIIMHCLLAEEGPIVLRIYDVNIISKSGENKRKISNGSMIQYNYGITAVMDLNKEPVYNNETSFYPSNDIERATLLATKMITEWGMSENLPPIKYVDEGNAFVSGQSFKAGMEEITTQVQKEIEKIIVKNYNFADKILHENWSKVEIMADMLMIHETIDNNQIKEIMEG